jgi:selenocysteine lyase/cysteine desulfurase
MLDEQSRRESFPTLEGRVYLNTAAEGIPPAAVGEALARYFRDKQQGMDGREAHAAEWEAARELAGRMYGLTAPEIGICSNSSEAFNLAAMALRLQPGDEVIINDLDFPSGRTPWIQPSCAATVRLWRAREGALRVEDLVPLLSARTRLLTTSLVSYYNGFMVPLPAVVEAVRKHSPALLAVDVTQALGRIPLDLRGVDLIVSSTHKWILASHGGGLVGVPEARAGEWTAPAGGWFNLQDAFEPDRFEQVTTRPGAASFMVGMPNYAAIYAIRAGLEYIRGVGVEKIEQAARPLVHACLEGLSRLPVELITPRHEESLAGILAFRHPRMEAVQARLRARNIHVMHTAGRMRVSLHGYNTPSDVERFLETLSEALDAAGAE